MFKSAVITVMEEAVLKAANAIVRDFGELENLQVSRKGPRDFVTSADKKAEKIIIKALQKARPDYGFLTEESGVIKGENEKYRWILDPIDGTTNFMHGIPHFCTSLALEETQAGGRKEIIAAVIFSPILNEMFIAEKGEGAYLNERKLRVSGREKLSDCTVAAYLRNSASEGEITNFPNIPSNYRILGAAALDLAYVAAGKLDGFWHKNLKSWDKAAGILLVREAKGMVSEINGGSNVIEDGNILATNGQIYDKLRPIIHNHYKK